MEKFTQLTAVAAPLPMANVDTDKIIPARFLKTIKRSGLGAHLFDSLRYDENENERPEFVLNRDPYRHAQVLIAFASTRPGRCSTSAFAVSSRPISLTSSITTVSKTAFCRSASRVRSVSS
jgi:hypothetical protein